MSPIRLTLAVIGCHWLSLALVGSRWLSLALVSSLTGSHWLSYPLSLPRSALALPRTHVAPILRHLEISFTHIGRVVEDSIKPLVTRNLLI